MLIRRAPDIRSSEITPESAYLDRRSFLAAAGFAALDAAVPVGRARVRRTRNDDKPNSYQDITHYNNFYEFGTGKEDPAENAGSLRTRPWKVEVSGQIANAGSMRTRKTRATIAR